MRHALPYAVLLCPLLAFPAHAQDAAGVTPVPGDGIDEPFVIDWLVALDLSGALFGPYAPTLIMLACWSLLLIVLARVSGLGAPRARSESGHPVSDYADPAYRRSRAHLNAVETSAPFIAAAVAAVLAGAAPFWVNLSAGLFLLSRITMAVVHVATENQPLRSLCFVIGIVAILALGALAVAAALLP